MKIKTIGKKYNSQGLKEFDAEVNDALAEGWRLVRRDALPGYNLGSVYYDPTLHAELVMLDGSEEQKEPEEPAEITPLEALQFIQDTCNGVSLYDCNTKGCQLYPWCAQLREGGDPTDWDLSKLGVGT